MSHKIVQIQVATTGEWVEAELIGDLTPVDLELIERDWANSRRQVAMECARRSVSRRPESCHWNWFDKASELHLLSVSAFGVVHGSHWQGVALIKTEPARARCHPDKGKPLVYLDYIESAPWNWAVPDIGQTGAFKGVGPVLFRHAVQCSFEEGFGGRVGLHSLPQAEGFYEKACGMLRSGPDPTKQDLVYFELTSAAALRVINSKGES